MLAQSILVTLLSAAPLTQSIPLHEIHKSAEPYNCGYVRTRWNSSVVAGIFAHASCKPFFYNETIGGYQDAFAYTLYGGCDCRFYSSGDDCVANVVVPEYTGSTNRSHEPAFPSPRPAWYHCEESD